VASLSGAVDVRVLEQTERAELLTRVFDGAIPPEADLLALLADVDPATVPPLFVGCGTEDVLQDANTRFAAATKAGLDVTTDFPPRRARVGALGRDDPRRDRVASLLT